VSLELGVVASQESLANFAAGARADARRLVVGALISDAAGRLYLQRRSATRALFPGAWDLVGGHAENGEDVRTALAREVFEETGWQLSELGPVIEVIDWESGGVARREVDMLVTVSGDLARPLLETDKHVEGRWLTAVEAEALAHLALSDRGPRAQGGPEGPDAWVFEVVARAFEIIALGRPR